MKTLEKNPQGVKKADLVVGIPSLNEAASIAYPVEQAALGLSKFFPQMDCVIINSDNNSADGTGEVFLNTDTGKIPKIYLSTPEGIKGRGNNFRNLFKKMLDLDAQAMVIIDSDVKSITPTWIKNLGEPLFKDFDFVAPLYMRDKYEEMINTLIAYPFTRSLYGRRVKNPLGGEFGFSRTMVATYLKSNTWNEEVSQFGIDIWLSTLAMNAGVPICQAFLGRPRIHRQREPQSDPGLHFRQIMNTIFSLADTYQERWRATKWSKPTAIFGFGTEEVENPPQVSINHEKLYQKFKGGFSSHWDAYRSIFSSETFQKLREIASLSIEYFEFPVTVWAKIIFDFAIAFSKKAVPKNKLIEVFIPLYSGMMLSFANKTAGMTSLQADEVLEEICLQFEHTKPYLTDKWK